MKAINILISDLLLPGFSQRFLIFPLLQETRAEEVDFKERGDTDAEDSKVAEAFDQQ